MRELTIDEPDMVSGGEENILGSWSSFSGFGAGGDWGASGGLGSGGGASSFGGSFGNFSFGAIFSSFSFDSANSVGNLNYVYQAGDEPLIEVTASPLYDTIFLGANGPWGTYGGVGVSTEPDLQLSLGIEPPTLSDAPFFSIENSDDVTPFADGLRSGYIISTTDSGFRFSFRDSIDRAYFIANEMVRGFVRQYYPDIR